MADSLKNALLGSLKKIDRPGTFCTSGRLPPTLPGLEVAGVGSISPPLDKASAAAIVKHARQAPYGKGTKTLINTKVRRVWEVDAKQVVLANPEWPAVLQGAVNTVQADLGLDKQKLEPHLYKLLLYEKGGFFLPHQDGEKLDRMVATLVIALPSLHKGGELIVRHEGKELTVDFAADSRFHTQFAAFYADCEHEVRPIASGHRLALVYNLTLVKSKRGVGAPRTAAFVPDIAEHLRQWAEAGDHPAASADDEQSSKLAILLDHEYSEAGLTRDALKGVDRARADVLFAAAELAGCDASLALATYWISGASEYDDRESGWGRRGRYRSYHDVDEDDEDTGGHTMGEVYETGFTAEHFSDADGTPLAFGKIPLDEGEIVADTPITSGDPDKEEYEGYTGNAGMTLERWYHRAAIMVWPRSARYDILCEAGSASAVGGLEQMVRQWLNAKPKDEAALKEPCLEFARRIIAHWPEHLLGERYRQEKQKPAMLSSLEALGDPALVRAWINGVLARDATVDPGNKLGTLCKQHGWATFRDELHRLFSGTTRETIERHADLLGDFSLRRDKNVDRRQLAGELAEMLVSRVEQHNLTAPTDDWRSRRVEPDKLLPPLVQSCIALDQPALLDRLVIYMTDRSKSVDLTTVQAPMLIGLES